jgi:hypothetical protein
MKNGELIPFPSSDATQLIVSPSNFPDLPTGTTQGNSLNLLQQQFELLPH